MNKTVKLRITDAHVRLFVGDRCTKVVSYRPRSVNVSLLNRAMQWLATFLPKNTPVTFGELMRDYPFPLSMLALQRALIILVQLGLVVESLDLFCEKTLHFTRSPLGCKFDITA